MKPEPKRNLKKVQRVNNQSFFDKKLFSFFKDQQLIGSLNLTVWLWLLVFCFFAFSACRSHSVSSEIVVAGSTSIQPFADEWAELFMSKNNKVNINVQGGGSSAGIMAVKEGSANIGMSSRELKEDEKDLKEIIIAYDGLAIIVHPANPVNSLAIDQVQSIFAGEITNWKMLNGLDQNITVVVREEGSGTRGAFQEMVMGPRRISKKAIVEDSNGVVREIVSRDENSIGFISLGLVNDQVKPVALDGVKPTEEAIINNNYRLRRPFLFLSRQEPQGLAQEFIDFVLSEEIQARLSQEGLIPAKKITVINSLSPGET